MYAIISATAFHDRNPMNTPEINTSLITFQFSIKMCNGFPLTSTVQVQAHRTTPRSRCSCQWARRYNHLFWAAIGRGPLLPSLFFQLEFFQTQRRQSLNLLIQVEISERMLQLNVQCFCSIFKSYILCYCQSPQPNVGTVIQIRSAFPVHCWLLILLFIINK
jgi:hypothetical protein